MLVRSLKGAPLVVFALFLSIAGGRWGAWIGFPSQGLFIIDLLFLFALFRSNIFKIVPKDLLVIFYLAIFILVELIISNEFSLLTRIRDLAPFIYFILFIGLHRTILAIPRQTLFVALRAATLFSLVWNLGMSFEILEEFTIASLTGIPIFSQRSDQFGFVAAIGIIVWCGKEFNHLFTPVLRNMIVFLFFLQVALLTGRAGGLAVISSVIYLLISPAKNFQGNRVLGRRIVYGLLITVILGSTISVFLPEQSALKRSGLIPGSDISRSSGQGTVKARISAQELVIEWTFENKFEVFGAGPGREIVLESGAYKWLSGSVDVRQPHNWWVSLFSRFGFFGFFYWTFLVFYYLGPIKRSNFMQPRIFILGAILTTSTFGVILESPFGLIPFYFFLMRNKEELFDDRLMTTK